MPPTPPGQASRPATSTPPAPTAVVGFRARRRSPAMMALGVALIVGGAMGGFLLYQETGERTPVLAVAKEVPVGDVIEASDLMEVSLSLDPAVKVFEADQRGEVEGKRAAVALVPGSVLAKEQVTDRELVKDGEQLVGIGLKASQLPATRLSPGDEVQIVFTPSEGEQAAGKNDANSPDAGPESVAARIVRVGAEQQTTGDRVVDVAVPAAQGARLAAQASTGDVALVVGSEGGS